MNKKEHIERYGEESYEVRLEYQREYRRLHLERERERSYEWAISNREKTLINAKKRNTKAGKYYKRRMEYERAGIRRLRNLVRRKHCNKWHNYKCIIAPDSQLHHNWVPGIAEYTGLALVEADQHMHGIIDVIQILEGEITLFTEKEIREWG